MLAYDGRSFGKLREVFGVLWDAALSSGMVYSDSIGGFAVRVKVRKRYIEYISVDGAEYLGWVSTEFLGWGRN